MRVTDERGSEPHQLAPMRRLDPANDEDRTLIHNAVAWREPVSRVMGVGNATGIFMWHYAVLLFGREELACPVRF